MAGTPDAHIDLMGPISEILNESPKDTSTKVGILVDLCAALLARDRRTRDPEELGRAADAMRQRLVKVTSATHDWMDSRVPTLTKREALK